MPKCLHCGKLYHTTETCFQLKPKKRCDHCDLFHAGQCTTPKEALFCRWCKVTGKHTIVNCRKLREAKKPRAAAAAACQECGDQEHDARECPFIYSNRTPPSLTI